MNYQNLAVSKLLERSSQLIKNGNPSKVIFQAPTGSGKTIIMASFLEALIKDPEFSVETFSFIWAAPRKLHLQSKLKLQNFYFESKSLDCKDFGDLVGNVLGENEILFLNWESINKIESNTIVKENEKNFYLRKVIENTLEDGRKIVLVIDESHHHATSEISKLLISDMSPLLTIEVSATPTMENPDEIVKVTLEEVRSEGMIKKSISLNEGFRNILSKDLVESELSNGQDSFVLKQALFKRNKLKHEYSKKGIKVNPLILIQLPDKKALEDEILRHEIVKNLKDEYGITTENGKLAIYLSEEKENLENIAKNTNETEVLIFKQAIALGWDCPRAQILVLFREHKSVSFSIQTVGRILRMPEPQIGHYDNEELNKAFVYTNISDITINEEMAKGYITIHTSRRIDSYEEINLKSVYRLRQRERTRLNSEFISVFHKTVEETKLKSKLKLENQTVQHGFISDLSIRNVDELGSTTISSDYEISIKNELDLQKLFDSFIRQNLEPFYPEERSIGRLKEAIYYFFKESYKMEYANDQSKIINIVMSEQNYKHFVNSIDKAKSDYITLVETREKELVEIADWNVPEIINFTANETMHDAKQSVMIPFYSASKFKTEIAFIKYLEKSGEIEWWFKNGERDATFFAIPYIENSESKPFYVDFVVKLKSGQIGLLDTKRGQTIKTATEKSDGLQEYIAQNQGIFGGIVDNSKVDFSGRWMVYKDKGINLRADDFSNWDLLEFN